MKIKKTIHVTKTAIRKGAPDNSNRCAVARGCRGAGMSHVSVGESIDFVLSGHAFSLPTPKRVFRFIERFDRLATDAGSKRSGLKPFSFVLKGESYGAAAQSVG